MIARILLLGALLASGGCATRQFDRQYAAGRWIEAARAFEADSSLHGNPGALHRVAVLYASPDRGTYEPATARAMFARVIELHPTSSEAESAARYIVLLDEMERVRLEANMREQVLQRDRDRLAAALEELRSEWDSARQKLARQLEQEAMVSSYVTRLEWMLRERDTQLRTLREELDRLKAIDLRTAPRVRGSLPDRS